MKLQVKGLIAVGIILFAAGIVIMFFLKVMNENALMGESPKYKPQFPAIPVTDITHAPQCNSQYAKQWIGCNRLDQ